MKKKDWPKNMEQSKKKKRIGVGFFFFQFRDNCESKRALTNFFACNEGLGDLHHQRHHHCSFSASTDFSALTSFFFLLAAVGHSGILKLKGKGD